MAVAVAPALPQELVAGFEDAKRVVHRDPRVVLLREHQLGVAAGSVHEVEIELVLVTIEDLDVERVFAYPAEARNVVIALALLADEAGDVDPARLAAIGIDNANTDFRIWVSGIGIFLPVDRGMIWNEVRNGILGHLNFIHLQIGNVLSVRRPEVIAAYVELFFVHPVDLAVEDV